MTRTQTLAGLTLLLALTTAAAFAQAPTQTPTPTIIFNGDCSKQPSRTLATDCMLQRYQTKTIYLTNASTQNEANEILVAARNMFDPATKIYMLASQNAIVVGTYPEEIARIEAFIHELDRPHKAYDLTFTIKETNNNKPIGTPQHFTINLIDGQRTTLKQGSKVPILTGSLGPDARLETTGVQTQYTYLDIGINFDVTLNAIAHGAVLTSKIEQSAVADEKSGIVPQDPVIRQTVLSGITTLTLNKPNILGSIDIPNSTHRAVVEALLELTPN